MNFIAKKNWKYDDPITEGDLNRIENGIDEAFGDTNAVKSDLSNHLADYTTHKEKIATETELGHVRLSDIQDKLNIVDSVTQEEYKWGAENGLIFIEKV